MPIYEYYCQDCHKSCEKLQKMSDPALVTCPYCQADALVKKISRTSFKLTGGGWYETDFKNSAKTAQTQQNTSTTNTDSE